MLSNCVMKWATNWLAPIVGFCVGTYDGLCDTFWLIDEFSFDLQKC